MNAKVIHEVYLKNANRANINRAGWGGPSGGYKAARGVKLRAYSVNYDVGSFRLLTIEFRGDFR
jgi:hypothetical protein